MNAKKEALSLCDQLEYTVNGTADWRVGVAHGIRYAVRKMADEPIPLILHCPECGARHIDEGEFATKVHHTHSCQECGLTWRPAVVATVGVRFLPGFKNGAEETAR